VVPDKGGLEEELTYVRTIGNTDQTLIIPVKIFGLQVQAVVDTAAQATIVNKELVEDWDEWGGQGEILRLDTAEKGKTMAGWRLRGIGMAIGNKDFVHDVVAAPISDEMILGLDFLSRYHVNIDLAQNVLTINNCLVPATMKRRSTGENFHVCRVYIAKKTSIPPYSAAYVTVTCSATKATDLVVEPSEANQGLMMGSGILNTSGEMLVSFLNDTAAYITLPRAHCCGVATELEGSVSEDDPIREPERVGVRRVETEGKEEGQKHPKPLPEHVQAVFDRAKPNVPEAISFSREDKNEP
jgi:hypothetical protein